MLKSWAVKRLAAALSDYLEGFTSEGVQASLGRDVGELDLRACINPAAPALQGLNLTVLNSDVQLKVRIPWRHLSSEPSELTVHRLRLEVGMQPASSSKLPAVIAAHKAEKEAAVQRLEERLKSITDGKNTGRLARISHAMLRQIQVSAQDLQVLVHREVSAGSQEPLRTEIQSARLENAPILSGDQASTRSDEIEESPDDLHKVLGFCGFAIWIGEGSTPILGPLAVDTRLWHSPAKALCRLQLRFPADQPVMLGADAKSLQYLRGCLEWCLSVQPGKGRRLPETVGRTYAALYLRLLRCEPYDEAHLRDIEEAATARWIVGWREWCRMQDVSVKQPIAPEEVPSLWRRIMGPRTVPDVPTDAEGTEDRSVDDLLDAADDAGLLPELEVPTRVLLAVSVPQCEAKCIGADQSVELATGGAECSVQICAVPAAGGQESSSDRALVWQVSTCVQFESLELRLDDGEKRPLLQLGELRSERTRPRPAEDHALTGLKHHDTNPLWMEVMAQQQEARAGEPQGWDVVVTLRKESSNVYLAPWSIHGLLTTVMDAARALKAAAVSVEQDSAEQTEPDANEFEAQLSDVDTSVHQALNTPKQKFTVRADVTVEAPILHLQVPQGGAELEVHVGVFHALTCSAEAGTAAIGADVDPQLLVAEAVDMESFSCACMLRETSVSLLKQSTKSQVQEPETMLGLRSTVMLHFRKSDSQVCVDVCAPGATVHFTPELMNTFGQLKLGLEYAFSPTAAPRHASVSEDGLLATAQSLFPEPESHAASQQGRAVDVQVQVGTCEVTWSASQSKRSITAWFQSMNVSRTRKGTGFLVDCSLTHLVLESDHHRLLECSQPLLVTVEKKALPSHLTVKAVAPPILAQWAAVPVQTTLTAAIAAHKQIADGEELAMQLLPVGPLEGISRRLWNRYMDERMKRIRGQFWQEACDLDIIPSEEDGDRDGAAHTSNPDAHTSVQVQAISLTLSFAGVSLVVQPGLMENAATPVKANISKAQCSLLWRRGGAAHVSASLGSMNLALGERHILMQRHAADELLHVNAQAESAKGMSLTVSWAQIAVVYRQRDFDQLKSIMRQEVVNAVKLALMTGKPGQEVKVPAMDLQSQEGDVHSKCQHGSSRSINFNYEYALSIAAPLVFLPTDQNAGSADLSVVRGGSLTQGSAESRFEPTPGDGFAIIDFGHLNISGSSRSRAVDAVLKQMHIHSALKSSSSESSWEEVVCPLGLKVTVDVQQERIDVVAISPLDGHSTTQHLRFSRAHVTQWLDILLLNINYAAESARSSASQQAAVIGTARRRKEFNLTLTWQGPLAVDVEFTRDSPLTSLRLHDGILHFRSVEEGFHTTLRCNSIRAEDCRKEAQNVDKTFFDSISSGAGTSGFELRVFAPPSGTGGTGRVDVDLARPTLYVLPMLIQDISIWFLSTYQQSAMGMQPASDIAAGEPVNPTPFAVAVGIPHAAVRVVTQWNSPEEYFEIVGGVFVSVTVIASYVRIDKVMVSSGCLQRGTAGSSPGLLCRKLECSASGSFENMEDTVKSIRSKALSIDLLTIRPLCIRLSALDQRLLFKSLACLMQYEANSAEPAEELWGRDPLSLAFQVRLATAASMEVEGIELQLLDDSKGQGARPALEVSFACPLLSLDMVTARGQPPTGQLRLVHFTVGMRSHNERLGQWEPVLAHSVWSLDCRIRAGSVQDEAVADIRLSPSDAHEKPVSLAVTVPLIHQIARLLPQLSSKGNKSKKIRYRDMLVGVNLSGLDCIVSRRGAGEEVYLNPGGVATPLDALIVDLDDTSTLPPLVLQFVGLEGAPCHEVSMAAEGSTIWKSGTSSILIRVFMPQPPQRVLLVSSTVLLTNKTPSDVEIRFSRSFQSTPGMAIAMQCPPCWVPAKVLETSASSQAEFDSTDPEEERIVRKQMSADECIRVPSNSVLGVPLAAIEHAGVALFQVRPAKVATGGVEYNWGKRFSTVDLNGEGAISESSCSEAAFDLPPHQLHLQAPQLREYAGLELERTWMEVCIDAPFRLANACPCEIHVLLWDATRTSTHLGEEHDGCSAHEVLEILDGNGGVWTVRPNGNLEIYPIKLDEDGWFYWHAGKDRERTRPRWRKTNLLQVERRERRITWRCFEMGGSMPSRTEECRSSFCLRPQQELPIFDVPANRTYFSVALRDRHTRQMSGWSPPLPVVVPGNAPIDTAIRLSCNRTPVQLGARRQQRRRTTVYARTWFVDATGLDACLVREDGTALPVFGDSISLLGEEETASIGLPGEDFVQVTVPNIGGSVKVKLSPVHDCVLQVEPISFDSTFGIVCNLLSLVPALMAFSQVDDCEIGFRQSGCSTTTWLEPGESTSLYWTKAGCPRQIQVAVRPLRGRGKTQEMDPDSFSIPFEIAERGIGAYPRVLMETLSLRRLVCVQIDQSGQLFTITASGESKCHKLVNRHPCLVVDASFEGDDHSSFAHFVVPCGQEAAIGRSASSKSRSDKLVLILGDVFQGSRSWRQVVDLDRTGTIQVSEQDNLRAAAVIRVELRARVARVTVDPLVLKGSSAETKYSIGVNLCLPQLSFLVVSDEPRSEILAGQLHGLTFLSKQNSGQRETDFVLQSFQVDLRASAKRNQVILASVGKQFLHLHCLRDDLDARNVKIRRAIIDVGSLEVNIDETLLKTLKKFASIAIPRALGLEMDTVLSRAGVPYNLSCGGPPVASRKYELRSIRVSEAKVNVWCLLSVARFPDIVQFLMNFSLSNTLEVNGASVKLQEQTFFEGGAVFEGSVEALGSQMWLRYKPNVISSWQSLVINSNTVLGGIFSRNNWAPKQRRVTRACQVPLCLQCGRVVVQDDQSEKKPFKQAANVSASVGATATLDQVGYARVMAARSTGEVEVFIRRVLCMLGCRVVDDLGLSDFAAEYMRNAREGHEDGFANLVELLTVCDHSWSQPDDAPASSAYQQEFGGFPPPSPPGDISSSDSTGADVHEDLARGGFIEFA